MFGCKAWCHICSPSRHTGTPIHSSLPPSTPMHWCTTPAPSTSYQVHLAASLPIQTLFFNLAALEALNRYYQRHWFSFWFWSGGGKSYSLPLLPSTLHNLNHICNRYNSQCIRMIHGSERQIWLNKFHYTPSSLFPCPWQGVRESYELATEI